MPGGPKHNADSILIAHLASGKSVEATAKLSGVSDVTIYRRLKNPAFKRQVRAARASVLERTLGHLSRGSAEAGITLRNLLKSEDNRIKLGAAKALLDAEHKFLESEDLRADLDELKAEVARLSKAERKAKRGHSTRT